MSVLLNFKNDLVSTGNELDQIITGFDTQVANILQPDRLESNEASGCVSFCEAYDNTSEAKYSLNKLYLAIRIFSCAALETVTMLAFRSLYICMS